VRALIYSAKGLIIRQLQTGPTRFQNEKSCQGPVDQPRASRQSARVYVSMFAKRPADGRCLLCDDDAPFKERYGEPRA